MLVNVQRQEEIMPQGDKSKYTEKQKRQAEHIEEGYEERGVPEDEAERRAWATVNKIHGGGEKAGGSGYGQDEHHEPMKKGGNLGGEAAAARPAKDRRASARKAARTRAEHEDQSSP
jgi:plasmid stabilization system protein ParE